MQLILNSNCEVLGARSKASGTVVWHIWLFDDTLCYFGGAFGAGLLATIKSNLQDSMSSESCFCISSPCCEGILHH